ncbi:hypothetical protein CP532_1536 [Ophiocordyceps camponoti-leonardi (nom. inval.)]|nr:hypothetical protein CP532_1536 [Ophiocordyceps camponoti-leonardi (nom. inval.)]
MALVLTLYLAIWASTSNAAPIPPIRGTGIIGLSSGIAGGSSQEGQSSRSRPGSSSWIFSNGNIPSLDPSRKLKSTSANRNPKPRLPFRGTVIRLGPAVDRSRKPGPPVDRDRKPGPPVDRTRKPMGDPFSTVKTRPYLFLRPNPNPAAAVRLPKKQEVAGFGKPMKQEPGSLDRPAKLQGTSDELTQKQQQQQQVPQKQQLPPPLPVRQPLPDKQQAGVSVAAEQQQHADVKESLEKESLEKQEAAPAEKQQQQQNAEQGTLPIKESREFKLANGDTYWTVKRVKQPLTDADIRPKDADRHSKEMMEVEAEEKEEDYYAKIEEIRRILKEGLRASRPPRALASEQLNLADGEQPSSVRRTRQPSPADETDGRKPRILSSEDELRVENGKVYYSSKSGIRGTPLTAADRLFLNPKPRGGEDGKGTFRERDRALSYVPVDFSSENPVATSRRAGRARLAGFKGLFEKKRGRKHDKTSPRAEKKLRSSPEVERKLRNSPQAERKLKIGNSIETSLESLVTQPRRSRFARIKDAVKRPFKKRRRTGSKKDKVREERKKDTKQMTEQEEKEEEKSEQETKSKEKGAEEKTGQDSLQSGTRLSTWLWNKALEMNRKISP